MAENMPLDVGSLICEMAGDVATTLSLALVSRTFRACVDPILYRTVHINMQNAKLFALSIKLRKNPEFFKRAVKTLSIDATLSLQRWREYPKSSIQEIIAVCTGLTAFGCGMQDGSYAHLGEIMHYLNAAVSTNSTLLRVAISLPHTKMRHVDFHAIPPSVVHLHCTSSQMAHWIVEGGFFDRFPRLAYIHMPCTLDEDCHLFSLLNNPLPMPVKLLVVEIRSVHGPTQDTYVRLSQVLRQLKDPRILVLAHPSFRFPSLPNLYRYPRNCSSYYGRNQLPYWEEMEPQLCSSRTESLGLG
ncbi:hypothetical protein BDZ89DRAFT_1164386 [Hymenopellis radicata]|nr:hypothetical protein BDZ89DRAFT_1164386 [Hymenopellis radicata]